MRPFLRPLLALAGCVGLWGQGPGRLPIRAFGIRDGLESTTTNALAQDERGLLWVGTEAGLHRFDGRGFHPVAVPLPSRLVLSLLPEGNRLWIGTRNGMALLEQDRPRPLPAGLQGLDAMITRLQAGVGGRIWFLASGQPWSADAQSAAAIQGWPKGAAATGLYADPQEATALACSASRVWQFTEGHWQPLDAPRLAASESLQAVARDSEGWIWLRSSRGAWSLPPAGGWGFRPLPPAGGFPIVEGLGRNRDGSVWISTGTGLLKVRGSLWVPLPAIPGQGDVSTAAEDREGSQWIGATELLQVLGRGLWRYWTPAEGLPSPLVWQVLEDRGGRAWAASDAGLALGTPRGWRTVQTGRFLRMALTPDGTLWAGCSDDCLLYRVAPGTDRATAVALPRDLPPGTNLDSLAANGDGVWLLAGNRLWLGRPKGAALAWDLHPPVGVGRLRKLLEDGQGGLYLANDRSLLRREAATWVPIPDLLPDQPLALARSAEGTLAVGYFNGTQLSLHRHDGRGWTRTDVIDPLPKEGQRVVYALLFDRRGRLWIGTSKGILRVALDGQSPTAQYDEGEGLPGSDISHQSLYLDREQRLWVCTATAVGRFDAQAEPQPPPLPAPVVTEVRIAGQAVPPSGPWSLKTGERVQIAFTVPSYLHPESLRFQAQLESKGRTEVLDLDRPSLDLPALEARSFRLTLLGRLPDRGAGPGAFLELQVRPPFWASAWAFLLYALVAAGFALWLHRWRQARLHARAMELEALVAERTEQFHQASKAKSAFLANMSHELRTPLNAILLYSELLQEEAQEAGRASEQADARKIHSAGRHLLGLIDDILDLSKIEAGHMNVEARDIDVPVFLADLEHTLRPLVEQKGNRFSVHLAPDFEHLRTDPIRLRQILSNLLSNAGKFTEGGEVELQARKAGDEAIFTVRDTGIGMETDQLRRIFDEFVQADASTTRRFGGTGLGLALVRHLSQLLGGLVEVTSEPGRGSSFAVRIPLEHPSAS